jgi:3-dehydroquinate dehydratase-2
MKKILVINGPNLNMLGKREPEIYGSKTLDEINTELSQKALDLGIEISFFQSNSEGEIVSKLNHEFQKIDGLIINAAAYTHTSIAIRDAVSMHKIPVCEVHLSNIYQREEFRHKSYLSDIASGVICGFGDMVYFLALQALAQIIKS